MSHKSGQSPQGLFFFLPLRGYHGNVTAHMCVCLANNAQNTMQSESSVCSFCVSEFVLGLCVCVFIPAAVALTRTLAARAPLAPGCLVALLVTFLRLSVESDVILKDN